jgi:hypothetical protein
MMLKMPRYLTRPTLARRDALSPGLGSRSLRPCRAWREAPGLWRVILTDILSIMQTPSRGHQ